MAGDAVAAAGRQVSGRSAERTFCSFAGVGAVVAGVAAAGAHLGVVHGVDAETCRRVLVAVAALERPGRNMRRRLHAGGGRVVVAARAIGIGCRMRKRDASKAGGAVVAAFARRRG